MLTRLLTQSDYAAYEAFLVQHADTSMFLRSNARLAGLVFRGETYQAHYYGAFEGEAIIGVIGLCWNGNVMPQAQGSVLDALITHTKRDLASYRVKGVIGPQAPAQRVLARLAPREDNLAVARGEEIYRVDLDALTPPQQLLDGSWRVRRGTEADLNAMTAFRLAFEIEALGTDPSPSTEQAARLDVTNWIAERRGFVLEVDGRICAQAAYNGQLPDMVQIGGVYTPPVSRNLGYARAVVAGALMIARDEGVKASTLFTQNPAAIRAYESIGYRRTGDYYMALLREGVELGTAS